MHFETLILYLACHTVFVVSGRLERCGENFVKVGCFNDNTRPLPELLLNKRNQLVRGWKKWKEFLEGLACSCANKTRRKGFAYFGLQFYAECWSGVKPNVTHAYDGISKECVGQDFTIRCKQKDPFCVGKGRSNYVYRLVTPTFAPECRDRSNYCAEYANKGYCKAYEHVRIQCPYSCKEC